MSFHFDVSKVAQCAATIFRSAPDKTIKYTLLVKLLYLADREAIRETGAPITGDRPFALDKGPILSKTLDLIKATERASEEEQAIWFRYFETRGYDVALVLDPGDDELSDYEIGILQRVYDEHGQKPLGTIIRETHELPEWEKTYVEGTSTPIHLRTLLEAVGRGADYEAISQRQIEDAHFGRLFG